MSDQVVAITQEGNALTIFTLSLGEYPEGKIPAVGDVLPLRAAKPMKVHEDGKLKEFRAIFLDGLYEVVRMHQGKGWELFPDLSRHGPVYIDAAATGYHVVVRKQSDLRASAPATVPHIASVGA